MTKIQKNIFPPKETGSFDTGLSTNELTTAAKLVRNAYQRQYRRNNPDKIKRYNTNYWERQAKRELNDPGFKVKQFARQGYTQREIAENLNISLGSVNKYLNKK